MAPQQWPEYITTGTFDRGFIDITSLFFFLSVVIFLSSTGIPRPLFNFVGFRRHDPAFFQALIGGVMVQKKTRNESGCPRLIKLMARTRPGGAPMDGCAIALLIAHRSLAPAAGCLAKRLYIRNGWTKFLPKTPPTLKSTGR